MATENIESIRQVYSGPMSEKEFVLLREIQAFIDFAIRNGLSFGVVMGTLSHDVNGLARYGFSLDEAEKDVFCPKVTRYANVDANAVGEPDEPAEEI